VKGGEGLQQDYGMRVYDNRLGRFLSFDPLADDYPSWSPYPFAMNRPIDGIDLDGLEWQGVNDNGEKVQSFDPAISKYIWAGYGSDGKPVPGTAAQATVQKGKLTYEYNSNAEAKTGSLSVSMTGAKKSFFNSFIFSNNTAQWVENTGGQTSIGGYQTFSYEGAPGQIPNPNTNYGITDHDVRGFSGEDLLFNRKINIRNFAWGVTAIQSDGLGPVDYLIGIGEWKFAKASLKILGGAQTTGTLGHAFTSRMIGFRYALDPRVERVTFDLGYKKMLGGGSFKYGPRPDVGVLFKNGKVKVFEVMSKTDVESKLFNRNLNFMRRNRIDGEIQIVRPFSLKMLYK
jgi:hypothetical protein